MVLHKSCENSAGIAITKNRTMSINREPYFVCFVSNVYSEFTIPRGCVLFACVSAILPILHTVDIRGIRTIAKFRLLTKIDFNVMHLINLSKKIWQKLQIRGSRGLQNSAISDTFFQFLTILCSENASN